MFKRQAIPKTPKMVDEHDTRRHSWPPFPVRVFRHTHDINENPFEFFISTPGNLDVEDNLTAGIKETSRSPSLSPLYFRIKSHTSPSTEPATSPVMKLRRWVERVERRYRHRQTTVEPVSSSTVPALTLSPPNLTDPRGRPNDRQVQVHSNRRSVRSHSARPRVWITPGDDLWPVLEEEQEDVGLGISI